MKCWTCKLEGMKKQKMMGRKKYKNNKLIAEPSKNNATLEIRRNEEIENDGKKQIQKQQSTL